MLLAVVSLLVPLLVVVLLVSPPMLLHVPVDPSELRPPTIVIMNPLRDRRPERLADAYFRQLAAGRVDALQPLFGNRESMLRNEPRYPPVSWRITERADDEGRCFLYYLVARGGGYDEEEGASFVFTWNGRHGRWDLKSYNAVY